MDTYSWAYKQFRTKIQNTLGTSSGLWNDIVNNSEEVHFQKGDTLLHHFERNRCIYIVVKGAFECLLKRENQINNLVWFFFDNKFDVITSMGSFNGDCNTIYSVIAMEPSIVIKLEVGKMEVGKNRYQALEEFYKNEIIEWFFNYFEIKNKLLALPPMDFLSYLESTYPVILKRVSSLKLAHFMGITPEWLSKLKKRRQLEPT